jgi:F0F1-type ATP synthase assembly protein I
MPAAGALSDRVGAKPVLLAGCVFMVFAGRTRGDDDDDDGGDDDDDGHEVRV